jgi:DNA-binding CsgD family transcriptional regulator
VALAHVEPVEHAQREAVVHLGSSDEVLAVLTGLIGSLPLDLGSSAIGEVDLWIVCDDDGRRRISVLPCNPTRCRARPSLPLNLVVTPITPSERRVLSYLPTHLNAAAIASELNLSRHTVKSHMASIYRKLDVTSRDAAVRRASELGVFGSCSESPYRRRPRLMRMARRNGLAASGDD